MSTNIKNSDGSLTKIAGKTLQYPINNNIGTSEVLQDAPIGHIISYMGTIVPAHYLACDGSTYNISDYPKLAEHFLANFGSKNYFGGDGITTFGVPDLIDKFLKGSDTAGIEEEAGLPNITGELGIVGNGANNINISVDLTTGAFTQTRRENKRDGYITGSNTNPTYYAKFNASKSNAVYGKSNTVTPLNTSVIYCIKAEPTYYMEIEDPGYSTDEVFTGKRWIDNKPIYRKVVTGNLSSTLSVLPNECNIIKYDISYAFNDAFTVTVHNNLYINNTYYQYFSSRGNIINCVGWYSDNARPYTVILEYTKTTD